MSIEPKTVLARVTVDQRGADRREQQDEPVLSSLEVFEREERNSFKRLDRRRSLRRNVDVRRRIARQ
ncbi:MAG: hypothetical protein ABI333_03020 [bacterium]